jgi:hypothetical protein
VSALPFNPSYDTVKRLCADFDVGFSSGTGRIQFRGSCRELIAAARANPNKFNIGTRVNTQNLAAELFVDIGESTRRSCQSGRASSHPGAEGRRRAGRVRDPRAGDGVIRAEPRRSP